VDTVSLKKKSAEVTQEVSLEDMRQALLKGDFLDGPATDETPINRSEDNTVRTQFIPTATIRKPTRHKVKSKKWGPWTSRTKLTVSIFTGAGILAWIVYVILAVAPLGGSPAGKPSITATHAAVTKKATPKPTPTLKVVDTYNLAQTKWVDLQSRQGAKLSVTVHSVQHFTPSGIDMPLEPGNEYLVADVELGVPLDSTDQVGFNELASFKLKDSGNHVWTPDQQQSGKPLLDSGELLPGQKQRGNVIFSVKKHLKGAIFFYPDYTTGATAASWLFERP
jgi:hypothetical protein